jgi:hypothetical protein
MAATRDGAIWCALPPYAKNSRFSGHERGHRPPTGSGCQGRPIPDGDGRVRRAMTLAPVSWVCSSWGNPLAVRRPLGWITTDAERSPLGPACVEGKFRAYGLAFPSAGKRVLRAGGWAMWHTWSTRD